METVYQPLSYESTDLSCSRTDLDESSHWVQAFIRRELASTKGAGLTEWKKPLRSTFPLEAFATGAVADAPIDAVVSKRLKQRKTMCAKDKRAMNVLLLGSKKQRKYAEYVALHGLWLGYMAELLESSGPSHKTSLRAASSDQILNRLMKADLHGAILKVIRSKCPSFVGIEGILILETKHTFILITVDDAVKVIPKANNVFSIGLSSHGLSFTLYGNHFLERTADRSAKKWKRRDTIDL